MSTRSLLNGYVVTEEGARQVRKVIESPSAPAPRMGSVRYKAREEDRRSVLSALDKKVRRLA